MNLPNSISLVRIVLAPLLGVFGWLNAGSAFIALFVLLMFSDALDGFIARRTGQITEIGARLDSIGDTSTYLWTALGFWLLRPEIVERESVFIAMVLFFYLLPGIAALLKFRRLVSYHTVLTKVTAILMAVGIFLLINSDNAVLFHFAVFFVALESVENIAITLKLDRPKSNLRSWWSV